MKNKKKNDEIVYLATPYTHANPRVLTRRFNLVNKAAANLINSGHFVFSPISMNHGIKLAADLPCLWSFWEAYDSAFLRRCSKMFVLKLPGWEKSVGVSAEIAIAKKLKIPIEYLEKEFAN